MDPSRRRRVRELFDSVAELPPGSRKEVLKKQCQGDQELLREVWSLLEADSGTAAPLHQAIESAVHDAATAPSRVGSTLGPYRIVKRLGAGGMGTVYEAERTGDFHKQVAVKVVHGALDSPDLLKRFHLEREILARLEHPHIARILDGGATEDGLPYLVLEYVGGLPIDAYADKDIQSVREKIALMRKVCQAVDYAHKRLIVHRDLKPANILVNKDGDPKLLDFGIAVLTDPEPGFTALTRGGVSPLTPEYASPEQIRGEPVAVTSDVYALGVILYRLLAGRHPFEEHTTPRELETAVLNTAPPPPSTAVTQTGIAGSGAGRDPRRQAKLRRELRGDLDNIVLKAMHKDPEQRYQSAAALEEDLGRYLTGLPIAARPATLGYRARKFAARHALPLAAAAVVVLLLTGAAVISTVAFIRADRARLAAETERATVEEINSFLMGMFEAASPVTTQSKEDLTVREVLATASTNADADLASRPDIAGSIHLVIGDSYRHLAMFEESLQSHAAAVGAFERGGLLETEKGVEALGAYGRALTEADSLEAAEQVLARALRLSEELDSPASASVCRRNLANILAERGRSAEADSLYRLARAGFRAHRGDHDQDLIVTTVELSLLYKRTNRLPESEQLMREALALAEEVYGPVDSRTGVIWADLGFILNDLDRPREAVECARKSLAIYESVYESDHYQVAMSNVNLADGLSILGEYNEAERHYTQSLEIFRRSLGERHRNVGFLLNSLGLNASDAGDYASAAAYLEDAIDIFREVYGPEHPYVASGMHNLAWAHDAGGRDRQAEAICRETLALRKKIMEPDNTDIARSEILLGKLLTARGRTEEAEPLLVDGVRICRLQLPESHGLRISADLRLGECLAAGARYAEAEPYLLVAHAAYLDSRGPEDKQTLYAAEAAADLYTAWGRPEKAAAFRKDLP